MAPRVADVTALADAAGAAVAYLLLAAGLASAVLRLDPGSLFCGCQIVFLIATKKHVVFFRVVLVKCGVNNQTFVFSTPFRLKDNKPAFYSPPPSLIVDTLMTSPPQLLV